MGSVVKANYVPMHAGGSRAARDSLDYYAHRPDEEGNRRYREAFDADNDRMDKEVAYSVLDYEAREYEDGYMYRIVVSPGEDMDADELRDYVRDVMEPIEEDGGSWLGTIHDDQTDHPHAHVLAYTDERLDVDDFAEMRAEGDGHIERLQIEETWAESMRYDSLSEDAHQRLWPEEYAETEDALREPERYTDMDKGTGELADEIARAHDDDLFERRFQYHYERETGDPDIHALDLRAQGGIADENALINDRDGAFDSVAAQKIAEYREANDDPPDLGRIELQTQREITTDPYLDALRDPSQPDPDPSGISPLEQRQLEDKAEFEASAVYTRTDPIGERIDRGYRHDLEDRLREEYREGREAGHERGLDKRELDFIDNRVDREAADIVGRDGYKWQGKAHQEIRCELREDYQEQMADAKAHGAARGLDDREVHQIEGRVQRESRDLADARGWSEETRREMEPLLREDLQEAASVSKQLDLTDREADDMVSRMRGSDVTLSDREARKLDRDRGLDKGEDYWRGVAYSEEAGASRGEARQIEESIRREAGSHYRDGPIGELLDRGHRHDHEDKLREDRLKERGYGL